MALTKRTYVDGQTIITAANLNDIQDHIITVENNYVPKTRTVAGKALSSNITLTASDVDAVPTSRTINSKALTGNITLSAADVGAVPVARTVNGKALSSNITLNAADVSAVPTTRKVNNKALSADISLAASDVGAVPTSRTVNGKALSSNITLASGDIGDDSGAGGSTVKASLAALKSSLNTMQNTFSHVGGAQSDVTCASTASTTLASFSLSAGTWIICGVHEWTTNIDAIYSDIIMDATSNAQLARSQNLSQRNGGGITTTVIVTLTTASTIRYITYNGGSAENTARRIHFDAIRIL